MDAGDVHTETFTNSQGWTLVRVTHVPTGRSVERARDAALQSPVQAQTECLEELRRVLGDDDDRHGGGEGGEPAEVVSRAEFEALAARVVALEEALAPGGVGATIRPLPSPS